MGRIVTALVIAQGAVRFARILPGLIWDVASERFR